MNPFKSLTKSFFNVSTLPKKKLVLRHRFRSAIMGGILLTGVTWTAGEAHAERPYTLFESGQVRPIAISPNGNFLFVVNTPDNQLEVFRIKPAGLEHLCSAPVGLEPVAVAARTDEEVWVVNHLSDSISIVDVSQTRRGHVVRTLLVGDEPRDIVFAGPNKDRAFVTTAHRGQNNPNDPQLTTPGIGRADVWVFDANNLGANLGGTPLNIITLFGDTPRALAATPDGTRVYAATFFSGNQTTTIHRNVLNATEEAAGGPPEPNVNYAGIPQPLHSLIVKFDGSHWVDEIGRWWDDKVNFSLPDKDVFAIDAMANPPTQVAGLGSFYSGVGTTLFNMIVNPSNGKVYVTNLEALNDVRFSGPDIFASTTVQGHLSESRITVIDPSLNTVTPRHLNKHIDYEQCCTPAPNAESELSLAFPLNMAISNNGQWLYVPALGSDKIGIYNTQQLENDTFVPNLADQVQVTGGGPTGVLLDEQRNRLYVLTRFDNAISIIDTNTRTETHHISMYNPEPPTVLAGRRFLYDAKLTSSHGDSACASCHIFGDTDHIAWDLGDPNGDVAMPPGPFKPFVGFEGLVIPFHPMKGPMNTQSLRGLANHGPMHWRGDRNGGFSEPSAQPDQGAFNEKAAFLQFNEAFVGLQGRASEIPEPDMEAFADFVLQITYPPNPIRNLDNSLTPAQATGRDLFFNAGRVRGETCESCHRLDPTANAEFGVEIPGFFGTDGHLNGFVLDQTVKVPHMRNLYQKVGMFGLVPAFLINEELDASFTGDQVRGFGFVRDGGMPTLERFLQGFADFPEGHPLDLFNPTGFPQTEEGRQERRDIEQFLLAFDSNLAPVVGQQITLTTTNGTTAGPRIDLLIARADAGECDLTVKGLRQGRIEGYLYSEGVFLRDHTGDPSLTDEKLRKVVHSPGRELTYTCTPPGSGVRIALDRDLDGVLDGDEVE